MSVPVDVELEARVAEAVAAHREVITELVRQAVDRELLALVDRELDAALEQLAAHNGRPAAAEGSLRIDTPPATVDLCSRCHAEPRLPDRRVCRRCKTADDSVRSRARRREPRRRRRPRRRAHTTTRRDRPTRPAAVAADGPHTAAHGVTARELLESTRSSAAPTAQARSLIGERREAEARASASGLCRDRR